MIGWVGRGRKVGASGLEGLTPAHEYSLYPGLGALWVGGG